MKAIILPVIQIVLVCGYLIVFGIAVNILRDLHRVQAELKKEKAKLDRMLDTLRSNQ